MTDPLAKGDSFDPSTIRWVLDDDALDEVLELAREADEIVVDLETTGLDEQNPWGGVPPRIAMAALTLPFADRPGDPVNVVVPLSHPEGPWPFAWVSRARRMAQAFAEARGPLVNQNLKFDLRWLYRFTGIDLSGRVAWDTQISSHLLDETSSTKLKERAPATFGVARWDDHDLSTPGAAERVPFFDLGVYAARDTYWTWRLAEAHRFLTGVGEYGDEPPVTSEDVEHYRLGRFAVHVAMPMVATLTGVEQTGIGLDVDWTEAALDEYVETGGERYDELVAMYPSAIEASPDGMPNFAPNAKFFAAWTEAAIEAGDLRVAALTPTGKPQWSKAVLKRQAREGSAPAETLLQWRQATKRAEFLRSWLDAVGPDGRVHANYNAGRVVTGRLSSSNPNLQQVTKALKPAFVPTPGCSIVEVDYSQIEVRLAAWVAQCEPLLDVYREGRDVYREMASAISGVPVARVSGAQRQRAKAVVLGFLYGMGEDGFRTYAEDVFDVVYSAEEAHVAREAFFSRFEGMDQWHASAVREADSTGQVVSALGRVRRLPEIHDSNPAVAGHAERQAINSPVQSLASDLMQMAAASVAGTLPGTPRVEGVRVVATVHDSIVIEVPRDDEVRVTGRAMRRMMGVTDEARRRFGVEIDVPLTVEAEVGDRWGQSRLVIA